MDTQTSAETLLRVDIPRAVANAVSKAAKLAALKAGAERLAMPIRHGFIPFETVETTLFDIGRANDLYVEGNTAVEQMIWNALHKMEMNGHNHRAENGSASETPVRKLITQRASEIVPEHIEFIWRGRLARGKHTMIAGEPGLGKSNVTTEIAAIVSRGGLWPCGEGKVAAAGGVIILSAEDGVADTIVPRLIAAGANLDRVHLVRATQHEGSKGVRGFDLQSDLDLLESLVCKIGDVALIIIDPVTAYLGAKIDSHNNADVRRVLAPIGEMAERLRVVVLTVTYFSKGGSSGSGKALHRIIGSIAFTAAPRVAFVVVEDPDDSERRLLLHVKNNISAPATGLAFRIAQSLVGDQKDIVASHVVWDTDTVTTTANEVMGSSNHYEPTAMDDAIDFLRSALAAGSLPVKEVERQAIEAGLLADDKPIGQSKAFRSAGKVLRIVRAKTGMNGGWAWSLPLEDALGPENALLKTRAPSGGQGTFGTETGR